MENHRKDDAGSKTGEMSDCMVCGSKLIYTGDFIENKSVRMRCYFCGKEEDARSLCINGHYVCNECHSRSILETVEQVCMNNDWIDPMKIAEQIFKLPELHMHGPEYHSIVPAVLVTASGNITGDKRLSVIKEAIKRGEEVKGGFCGSHGACGAGIGVGIAYSIIHRVTPYSEDHRGAANRVTALALSKISEFGGPRCCKRDSIAAIEVAKKTFKEFEVCIDFQYACGQSGRNSGCIHHKCPYFIPGAR